MTDSNSSAAPEPLLPSPAAKSAATPARGAPLLLWLLSLLALAGVVLVGFVFLQQRQAMETLAGNAYALEQRSTTFEQRLAAAEAERVQLAQRLQSALDDSRNSDPQAEMAGLRRELDTLRRDVVSQVADSGHDWLLVEATTLLRLAQQQAVHGHNVASGISLYLTADARLQLISDPALQPARAALQLELDALRAVEVPQIQALYLQLGELAQQLAALDVQGEGEPPLQFVAPDGAPLAVEASWWEELKSTLSQYFVVTRRDVPVLAQLTPQQDLLVRQSIALQLETARLALLQGDVRLYQAAIDAAALGITQQLQGDARPAVLASLQRLREEPVRAVIPPLGSALQVLEQIDLNPAQDSGAPMP
jgi:uroporphyrin-3 C-methyltransferase